MPTKVYATCKGESINRERYSIIRDMPKNVRRRAVSMWNKIHTKTYAIFATYYCKHHINNTGSEI